MNINLNRFSSLITVLSTLPLLFFGYHFYNQTKAQQAKFDQSTQWPSTVGRLVTASVATGTRSGRDNTGPRRYYYPQVEYVYYVDGIQYLSQRYSLENRRFSTPTEVETVIDELRQQRPITVYYNPNSPSESVLKTGGFNAIGTFWMFAGCAVAFVGIPLILTVATKMSR